MCVSCYISKKIRVGRSLLIFFFFFFFFFFIFPDFTKKHNRCVVCTKYITKSGLFLGYLLTIPNAWPAVKAFHRMNLNQNKCLNSNTASNTTAKVAKPIKNGRKQGRLFIFLECQ